MTNVVIGSPIFGTVRTANEIEERSSIYQGLGVSSDVKKKDSDVKER